MPCPSDVAGDLELPGRLIDNGGTAEELLDPRFIQTLQVPEVDGVTLGRCSQHHPAAARWPTNIAITRSLSKLRIAPPRLRKILVAALT